MLGSVPYAGQLWLFWLAPLLGAAVAGVLARVLYESSTIVDTPGVEERRVN